MAATRDDILEIAVGDQHICGTLVTPGALTPGVLFVHGWGGSQQQYVARAREVAALGCICLTFDLRGHARTQEHFKTVTREDNLNDLVAAYDVLVRQRGVDASAIAVVGSSYGGYLAAILTELRPVRWLVLRAPALYKDSEWTLPKDRLRAAQQLEAYRRVPVRTDDSRALRACDDYRGHALIVESERDSIIPAQVVANYRQALANAASLTYRLLEGADHALGSEASQQAYTTVLVRWLSEMVRGARSDSQATPVIAKAEKVDTVGKAAAQTGAESTTGA
jgi:pimeloyl-ACP methyl ester carboxylesterase